jgi:hypothetical protein
MKSERLIEDTLQRNGDNFEQIIGNKGSFGWKWNLDPLHLLLGEKLNKEVEKFKV